MKAIVSYRFAKLSLLVALPLLVFQLAPSQGEPKEANEEEEEITPLTGYRLISDRAFDPFTSETNQGVTVTPDGIVAPTPAEPDARTAPTPAAERAPEAAPVADLPEAPVPYEADILFPTYVQPSTPKAPSSLRPQTTPGASAIIEFAEESAPEFAPESARESAPEAAPGATSEPDPQLTDGPKPDLDLPIVDPDDASGKTPPQPKELAFPLTLTIPGYDPEAARSPAIEPADGPSGTASQSMDQRNEVGPTSPLLQFSSPSVVGVGATLAGSESDIHIDALVPFWQSHSDYAHTILFLVPRVATTEEVMTTGSLGLGVRSLRGEGSFLGGSFPWIIGANVFYDFTHSTRNFDYNQFGAGIEWMSPFLDLRVNGYFPENTENKIDETSSTRTSTTSSTSSETSFGTPFASGHSVLQPFTTTTTTNFRRTSVTSFFEQYERALRGFDGEAGILLPDRFTLFPVRLYGGFYSFDNPYGEDLTGPKARIEARPFSFLLLDASWYQDEELLGSTWFLGARARMTIGGSSVTPGSSKPLHDTKEGPKTVAYNPHASFRARLVERIPRNYQAVLTTSPFLENEARRQTSVSRFSQTDSSTGQITLASDLLFVDPSRSALGGAGSWQNPLSTIQDGANLAIANLGSTGRIWTVWTQGGVGSYKENITVAGSVHFASSSLRIAGGGGQAFGGTGDGPIVEGGFLFRPLPSSPGSPSIAEGSVRGYEIRGGHSAASFAGITFVNVRSASASRNRVDTIGGTGIAVINTGGTRASGTFASNGIFNTGGDAIHFDLSGSSRSNYTVADSGFQNPTGSGVRVDASDSANYGITVTRSGASGLSNSAIFLNARDNSSGSLTVSNSSLDTRGVEVAASGNAEATLTVSGTRLENNPNSAFTLAASDSARLTADIRNNVLQDNESALSLEVTGNAVTDTSFSGNSVTNSTDDAVVARYEGTAGQELTVSGNAISATDGDAIVAHADGGTVEASIANNTIDTATSRGIVLRSSMTGTMRATVAGNGTSNTSAGGVLLGSADGSNMDGTVSNNIVSNSGDFGVRIESADTSNSSVIVEGNTVRETVAAAIDLLASNNSLLAVLLQANVLTDSTTVGVQGLATDQSLLSLTAANNNISNTTEEGISFAGQDNSSSRFEARSNLVASTGNRSGIRSSFLGNHDTEVILANNVIEPIAQQGIEVDTSDASTGDFTMHGNRVNDSSQDAIRMTLYSTEDQTVALYANNLQRNGANGFSILTQGTKNLSVYDNEIGTTGGAAVRVRMESGGLVLNGASQGNNVYNDQTPVPFDDGGTAPFTGGAGVRINGIVYP